MKLLIRGGRAIDPATGLDRIADLYIMDGKIKEIQESSISVGSDCEIIDAHGKWVVPGFIDMHVHLREPGFEAKETIATGTRAAAKGGFTSVACMPNTNPVIDNQALVEFIKARSKAEGKVNVFPIGAITKGSRNEELAEIGDMFQAGVVAISDDGQPVGNAQLMRLAMQYASMFDLPVISHCEEKNLVADGVMNEGYYSTLYGLKGISRAAEETMVARDILLAELTGARLHIAHVSTRGSVELVRMAQSKGVRVTAEATPHHIALTDEAVGSYDTSTKINPPLRTSDDIEAVKEGLKDGTIAIIATDHAPHTVEEKDVEYNYAPFGTIGLETAWGIIYQELVETGVVSVKEALAKLTCNPANIFGLKGKGSLACGSDADITIIDPEYSETITVESFESKARNSVFIGRKIKALPVTTIVGGKIVMKNRTVL